MKLTDPNEIEKKSFEIIEKETIKLYGKVPFDPLKWEIVRRLIHTTADFEIIENIIFSNDAIQAAVNAMHNGCVIVTDTNMAKAGISGQRLKNFQIEVECFVADHDVSFKAKKKNITRSMAAIEKAREIEKDVIFAIGNAPTALFHLLDLMDKGEIKPAMIIGMVVGFVGAYEAKEELILRSKVPFITLRGRKGGSTLVAATINALLDIAKKWEKKRS